MGALLVPLRGAPIDADAAVPRPEVVAVLAAVRERGLAIVRLLASTGLTATVVDADGLSAGIRDGSLAAAILCGEALGSAIDGPLLPVLADQPAWSDFPFVIVAGRPRRAAAAPAEPPPNAVLVSRPLRTAALLSATRSAVRARRRQWGSAAGLGMSAEAPDGQLLRHRELTRALFVSRMGAMSEMASALAHEINQPLSTVTNYVAGCRRLLAGAAAAGVEADLRPLFAALARAEAETMRAGEIVRRMRELVAVEAMPRRSVDIADIVAEARRTLRLDLPGAQVEAQVAPGPMEVIDPAAIQHVVVSLVRNGWEGMRGGPPRPIVIAVEPAGAGLVEVRVTDPRPGGDESAGTDPFSAIGVHREDDARIRLAICRTIVEAHGGAIYPRGSGADACVAFTLPLAADRPATALPFTPSP